MSRLELNGLPEGAGIDPAPADRARGDGEGQIPAVDSAEAAQPEPDRTTEPPRSRNGRILQAAGAALVAACFLLAVNTALARQGLPHLSSSSAIGRFPLGRDGVRLLAGLSALVLVAAGLARRISALQWGLVVAAGLWIALPGMSQYIDGYTFGRHFVGLAIIAMGVGAGAALAGARVTRWVVFVTGSLWSLSSLAMGLYAILVDSEALPRVLLADRGDRYTRWIGYLGLDAEKGSVEALVGLSQHRQLLGMLMALVLVVQVRHLLTVTGSRWRLLALTVVGPVLTGATLLWTMSRTAIGAAILGLALSLLPWERLGRRTGAAVVALLATALPLLPLLTSDVLAEKGWDSDTLVWRIWIWEDYFANPELTRLWGIGPREAVPLDAAHAHNEALQTLVIGGWIGTASLLAFTLLGAWATFGAARFDRRTSLACLLTAALIAQFEIISPTYTHRELNPALIVMLAVVVSAAALGARARVRVPAGAGQETQEID